jgi:quinol monooxygenase YgiN
MPSHISWWVELRIRPADGEAYRTLTSEMVELSRKESGALIYERYISSDGETKHVY